jgi:hypothetical protein
LIRRSRTSANTPCCSQLYLNSSAHAQEAACSALLQLPQPAAERFLIQV